MSTSALVKCKCGKAACWVEDGKEHPAACPYCGRRYRGEYNPETLTIEAVEVGNVEER